MKLTATTLSLAVVLTSLGGCGGDAPSTDSSAAPPSTLSTPDAGTSLGTNSGHPPDAGAKDAGPAPVDASSPPDASLDASADGSVDASIDAASDVDANAPLSDPRLDELQVKATHNSYHVAPAVAFDASHKYTHKPLDQQLAGGVRGLEIDLHLGLTGVLEVYHLPIIDPNTTCSTLDDCLTVINRWSELHPTHTPIFVWFEVKDDVGGSPISSLQAVDDAGLRIFGANRLITPAWLQGSYASPHARLTAEGWPRLHEVRGKVMLILLNDNDGHSDEYTHGYTSLDGRRMFASAAGNRIAMPWAVVTKMDPTDANAANAARDQHLLTCANVCSVDKSDAECASRLTTAIDNGLTMLADDLPFPISGRSYYLALPHGSPGCNPLTMSTACSPGHLE